MLIQQLNRSDRSLHFCKAVGVDEWGRKGEPPNNTARIMVTDHKAEEQRALKLVYLLIILQADFAHFFFFPMFLFVCLFLGSCNTR